MLQRYLHLILSLIFALSLISPVLASSPNSSIPAETAEKMLADGNSRFVYGKYAERKIGREERSELAKGQHPFAVIVTCSDSRVAPELLFDQGLGDLFVVRVAGNVLDSIELGSIEYAVEHLGAKLIVILGHEKCGAVKAAVDGGELPPNIQAIADKIHPAVTSAKTKHPANIYEATADANIQNMITMLQSDHVITHITGIKILGAKYRLESGNVYFFK